MDKIKIGKVIQTFANGEESKPYLLKRLPTNICWQWQGICHLYTLDDKYNHTAHIDTLKNI